MDRKRRADESEDKARELLRRQQRDRKRRATESEEDKASRLLRRRQRDRDRKTAESEQDKASRLLRRWQRDRDRKTAESEQDKASRLLRRRKRHKEKKAAESAEVDTMQQCTLPSLEQLWGHEPPAAIVDVYAIPDIGHDEGTQTEAQLLQRQNRDREKRAAESEEDKASRLLRRWQRDRDRKAAESEQDKASRLLRRKERHKEKKAAESAEVDTMQQCTLPSLEQLWGHEPPAAIVDVYAIPDIGHDEGTQTEAQLLQRRNRDREKRAAESEEDKVRRLLRRRQRYTEKMAAATGEDNDGTLQLDSDTTTHSQTQRSETSLFQQQHESYSSESGEGSMQHRLLVQESDTVTMHHSPLPLLDQPWVQSKLSAFHSKLNFQFNHCSSCCESFPGLNVSASGICSRCSHDAHVPKLYSDGNNMDPGTVPPVLQGLTQVEEMLISSVIPMMSVYKLPHGQIGYGGHIINLPQDVSRFVSTLPRHPSDLDLIVVRKATASGTHKDFRVRRSRVQHALQWLIKNNSYYSATVLDNTVLAELPEDGDLPSPSVVTLADETEDCNSSDQTASDLSTTDLTGGSFVPLTHRQVTEQDTIQQAVSERHAQTPLLTWPQLTNSPLNEFTSEGYMTCAFPTLFPTGTADFTAPRLRRVTIGNYFKHLMLYKDGRFAKHPRFRYFALNTEMRWRAMQTGRIYIRQHPQDAQLSISELRDIVGSNSLSSRVLHFASSISGTRPYWMKQRSRLISMVDTLGLPTLFFTHSAADLHWPELAHLICPAHPEDKNARSHAVIQNPAIADCFFCQRVRQFMKYFYQDVLGVKDYWLRFEYQHRGSPHVHGLAWLPNAPDIERLFTDPTVPEVDRQKAIRFIDSLVSTTNPAVLPDGSNFRDAPLPQTCPHVCNRAFADVGDYALDLQELIATCQRHTKCSTAYCLKTKNGQQVCRFGYPQALVKETTVTVVNQDTELETARNDPLINSYNPVQLCAWRANVDLQYCVSRHKVIQYCAKYATKCEPRSHTLIDVFGAIVRGLDDDDKPLKAVQKLLINTTADRDYSAQETCHLLLQLPMVMTTRDFVFLSLDGSRQMQENLEEGQPATSLSSLDHYMKRPSTQIFESMTLLHYVQHYSMPKYLGAQPCIRQKAVVVIVRPFCSADPNGPNYEQYCTQKLMLYQPFRDYHQLLAGFHTYTEAYCNYLQSGNIPSCLEDDVQRLLQKEQQDPEDHTDYTDQSENEEQQINRRVEEWMTICTNCPTLSQQSDIPAVPTDWSTAARQYPNLEEMPSFISRCKEDTTATCSNSSFAHYDPNLLQDKQLLVYETVCQHSQFHITDPLRMIVSGTAGTGKSYLIHCLKTFLQDRVRVLAPTGVAAFNVEGITLHSFFHLPTHSEFKDLAGKQLQQLQQDLAGVEYLIIDEMSMVGRRLFAQVDMRLRQAFPQRAEQVLGGCSCLLVGDFGQLSPVMDLPLYTSTSKSSLADLGRTVYQTFNCAVTLSQIMRQSGHNSSQIRFRELLCHLRDGTTTTTDWQLLLTRTLSHLSAVNDFKDALHLYPTVEAVAEHNLAKLKCSGQPVATIKASHSGPGAAKASSDEAAGLEPTINIAHGARIMLTTNLWIAGSLVNGAIGTVHAICYHTGGPPDLPIAVMIKFDSYYGPTLHDNTVPIIPIRRTWLHNGSSCSRLQLPLKLAWAVTIHKAQGLTLDKVVVDVGKKEFSAGLTFVACSRVRNLLDLAFAQPFDFQRLSNIANSHRLVERKLEDARLCQMEKCLPQHTPHSLYISSPSTETHTFT